MKQVLNNAYKKLYKYFGPQHWWPADSPFEVIIGAILTQNTNWQNVEKAIDNLKKEKLLSAKKLYLLNEKKLACLIRPSGYFNIKAKRLRSFLKYLFDNYSGSIKKMFKNNLVSLREELLNIKGIGEETADSILLYAGGMPIFVIDTYTKRFCQRHKITCKNASYKDTQDIFMDNLKKDVLLFNEFHALLVRLGKEFCLKSKQKCELCPLKD
ncbi:MAG: endonuclease III domain-containing protein [Candidatus Gygaella obscura]|nr:endonuclease III domain-containing protein [Candidatus Gygaella obscura]